MKLSSGVLALSAGLAVLGAVSVAPTATAQSNYYYVGKVEGGEPLVVNLDSITSVGEYDANFDYVLGEALVSSQAHCSGGVAWTTLSDGVVHYAQSQATREMVRTVCSYLSPPAPVDIAVVPAPVSFESDSPSRLYELAASTQTAFVYDPSSNVRATPNGRILCSIDTRMYINIYGQLGDWYDTDACGEPGVIHISQIQF